MSIIISCLPAPRRPSSASSAGWNHNCIPASASSMCTRTVPKSENALKRAQRYLGLTTLAVILIAGCAIAMSVRRYTERHYDLTAILKCFGLRSARSSASTWSSSCSSGIVASVLGCGLAWLLQQVAVYLLRGLLPQGLVPASSTVIAFGVHHRPANSTGLRPATAAAARPLRTTAECFAAISNQRPAVPGPFTGSLSR